MAGEHVVVLFAFVVFAMAVVFGILLPLWTYSDARRNSPQSPLVWALVVFFGGIAGLVLYFVIGRDRGARTDRRPREGTGGGSGGSGRRRPR